jgi:cytochrome c peroxidase
MASVAALGCQPAARFAPQAEEKRAEAAPPPEEKKTDTQLPGELTWFDPAGKEQRNIVPIEFVHPDRNKDEWQKLDAEKKYWTLTNGPEKVASSVGALPLSPLPVPGMIVAAPGPQVVKIKVPLGLPDPTPFIPPANPPTLAKWELGRQLFFDDSWLSANKKVSCADCHRPDHGFTDGKEVHGGFDTPTLVNAVYQPAIFWDGRASCLEEVVARSLEDERDPAPLAPFRHTWGGSVRRLQNTRFLVRFNNVFGTPPTQDAVGKALATYLRTLLAGDSVYDRAVAVQTLRKGKELEKADYEKVLETLDAAAVKQLEPEGRPKNEIAGDLIYGYRLTQELKCVNCHRPPLFSDGGFHNVGLVTKEEVKEGMFPGRIAHVPIGLRQRELMGAFKTPTLRGLLRTAPYFHNGSKDTLEDALTFHTEGFALAHTSYIAREFREGDGPFSPPHKVTLTPEQRKALVVFLRGLNGEEVDAYVRTPPP